MPLKAVANNGSSFIFNMQFNLIKVSREKNILHWNLLVRFVWNRFQKFIYKFIAIEIFVLRAAQIKCFSPASAWLSWIHTFFFLWNSVFHSSINKWRTYVLGSFQFNRIFSDRNNDEIEFWILNILSSYICMKPFRWA